MAPAVVEYPVHTPPLYLVVTGALAVLGVAAAALLVWELAQPYRSWPLLGLTALMIALPVIYWYSSAPYRIRGVIRLDREYVEVPDARGVMHRFAAAKLRLHVTRMSVRYTMAGIPVARVSRGMLLDIMDDGARRRVSTLALVEPDHGEALLADLERVTRGEAPQGPYITIASGPQRPRDHYEDQLDRELAALD